MAAALDRAQSAFAEWRERPIAGRAELLRALAATLRSNRDDLAREATLEMGKPIGRREAEVEKCAWTCEYYAEHAERFLADAAARDGRARATSASSRSASCSP